MEKGDFAALGGLLALLVVALLLVAHYSQPAPAQSAPVTVPAAGDAPSPVQTYPPFTLTPWCIGAAQYAEFRMAYGTVDGPWWNNQYVEEYDFNHDGSIDILDYMRFRQIYGQCQ